MRRLLRILRDSISIISLLVSIATSVLWVRSYWRTDSLTYGRLGMQRTERPPYEFLDVLCSAWSRKGSLVLWSQRGVTMLQPARGWRLSLHDPALRLVSDSPPRSVLGFTYVRDPLPYTYVIVPYWAIVTASLPLPMIGIVFSIRRRRKGMQQGRCEGCGYDLRATPLRCPECGMAVKQTDERGVSPSDFDR